LKTEGDDRLTGTKYHWLRNPETLEDEQRREFGAVRSRLQPMKEVAGMLKRRVENIMTYLRHRITNAAGESINAKIQ
jgi:transposase